MNNLKNNPSGVDRRIDRLQKSIYSSLSSNLLAGKSLLGYGRVYLNRRNDQYVLEAYTGKGEYDQVGAGDKSCFFFDLKETVDLKDSPSADVDIIFFIKLDDFYTDVSKRMDEEIKETVYSAIYNRMITLNQMVTGIDYVNGILSGYFDRKNAITYDMHPWLVFTIRGSVTYNYKDC